MNFEFLPFILTTTQPLKISHLIVPKGAQTTNIAVKLKNSYEGVGEFSIWETTWDTQIAIRNIKKLENIIPDEISSVEQINTIQYPLGWSREERRIRAAIDIALYDLLGKVIKKPVYTLINGKDQTVYPTAYTIWFSDTIDEMIEQAQKAIQKGASILKVKIGGDNDIEIIQAIRQIFKGTLCVDPNDAWSFEKAILMCKAFEKYNISLVESPLKESMNIELYKKLHKNIPIPIGADDPLYTFMPDKPPSEKVHLFKDAFDMINIKPLQCGGITESFLLHIIMGVSISVKIAVICMIRESRSFIALAYHILCLFFLKHSFKSVICLFLYMLAFHNFIAFNEAKRLN